MAKKDTAPNAAAQLAEKGQLLDVEQRADLLWKIIGRFDLYIGSINTRAAILIAINTFIPGSIAIRWKDIQNVFGESHREAFAVASVLLVLAVIASLVSLFATFFAMIPMLDSPKRPGLYHSDIFFQDIAANENVDDYRNRVNVIGEASMIQDLVYQAFSLSRILMRKFRYIRFAVHAVYCQMAFYGMIILDALFVILRDAVSKAA